MRLSTLRLPALLTVAAVLSACASTGPAEGNYSVREQKLSDECQARGGILVPTGAQTGRPETDNICKITGGASRLPNN